MSDQMLPLEGGEEHGVPGVPDAPAAPVVPEPVPVFPNDPSLDAAPPVVSKRKLDWPFAILGFLTPWLVGGLQVIVSAMLPGMDSGTAASIIAGIAGIGSMLVVVVMIVALIVGRIKDMNRLRSFGIGGLASYGVIMLVGLLAFGACMITLNSGM